MKVREYDFRRCNVWGLNVLGLKGLRMQVGHGVGVVVIRIPVRPNFNSAEFGACLVLNYSSYVVLG